MWLTDPQTGEKSVSVTLFTLGTVICLLKLLTSGIIIGSIHISTFSGTDFAASVGALGAVYTMRKHSDNLTQSKQ